MKIMRAKFFLVCLLLVALVFVTYLCQPMLMAVLVNLQYLKGPSTLVYFSLLFIFSSLLLIPLGLPLNLLAGLLWGTLLGGTLVSVLAIFVAAISFFLARNFGNYFSQYFFDKYPALRKFTNALNRHDWQFVFLTRINPIFPFNVLNYVFGFVPGLSFKNYIIATLLGNILPSFALASMGSVLRTLSLTGANHDLIWQIGIALLFITALFILKIVFDHRKNSLPEN